MTILIVEGKEVKLNNTVDEVKDFLSRRGAFLEKKISEKAPDYEGALTIIAPYIEEGRIYIPFSSFFENRYK